MVKSEFFYSLLSVLIVIITGCYDPVHGPMIRNGMSDEVSVTIEYKGEGVTNVSLEPGTKFSQRKIDVEINKVQVFSSKQQILYELNKEALISMLKPYANETVVLNIEEDEIRVMTLTEVSNIGSQ